MTNKNLTDVASDNPGVAVQATDIFLARQTGAADTTKDSGPTAAQIKGFTTTTANQKSVDATGTVYSLTASAAAVTFGTTSPALTLDLAGTYLIITNFPLTIEPQPV